MIFGVPPRHLLPLAATLCLVWAVGCNAAFGVDELEVGTAASSSTTTSAMGGGGAGATTASSTTSASGGAGGGVGGAGGTTSMGGAGGVAADCGDGQLDNGEECDDGNLIDGDFCSALCTVECDPPRTKHPTTNHCYQFVPNPELTWPMARDTCNAIGPSWYLASVTSVAERDFVDGNFATANPYWVGGNDIMNEGTFVWDNGEPWMDILWEPSEPTGGSQDCVAMTGSGAPNDDLMSDFFCAASRDYACEHTPLGTP